MVTDIKNWSTTAGSNTSVGGVSIAEGMAPSNVNNAMRATNAAVREWFENADWIDFGHTVTYASATTFTIAADVTSIYHANRRIRATDSSTLYGTIVSSNFSSPNTTVTVTFDAGSLSASLSAVAVGATATNDAEPRGIFEPVDADILRADTTDTLAAGYDVTTHNAGSKSSGTYTPAPSDGSNLVRITNDGAFTLAPPASDCTMVIEVTNGSSAGAITTSSFTKVEVDDYVTTDTHKFLFFITRVNGSSLLTVKALQ